MLGKVSKPGVFDANVTHFAGISQVECNKCVLAKLPVEVLSIFHLMAKKYLGSLSVSHFIQMTYHAVQLASHVPDKGHEKNKGGGFSFKDKN